MTNIAVTGATGAMGSTVIQEAADIESVATVLAVSEAHTGETLDGIPAVTGSELNDALRAHEVDVVVDFTVPAASIGYVEAAASAGVAAVVGTTGFTDTQFDTLRDAATNIPIMVAPNFSRGIAAVHQALASALPQLDGYDIEVTETHHRRKRDAPSGTALGLLETIEEVRGNTSLEHGRSGEEPRGEDAIGVHARRAGTITGEHEVLMAGNHESVQIVHRAESRGVFAAGALDATSWIADKPAGWYRFAEVLDQG